MKLFATLALVLVCFLINPPPCCGAAPTASNTFHVNFPPPPYAGSLLPDSPFGINTAFQPDSPDLDARLTAMQQAGIKWGRQDFTWRRIEKTKGGYDWS